MRRQIADLNHFEASDGKPMTPKKAVATKNMTTPSKRVRKPVEPEGDGGEGGGRASKKRKTPTKKADMEEATMEQPGDGDAADNEEDQV